jgi:putative ABC transport system permease protein
MRLLWEGLRLGLTALWNHKLRTFLTLLGHIMGVITVITLVSLIQGLNQYVSEKILLQGAQLLQADKIGLAFNEDTYFERLKRPDLELDDYEFLRERSESLASVGALLQTGAQVKHDKRKLSGIGVIGLTAENPFYDPYPLVNGRPLREEDVRGRRRVAMLGSEVARELFPVGDPVGQDIRVGSRRYTVIGVFGERGKIFGQSTDNFVAIPITELMGWSRDRQSFTILAQPAVGVPTEEALAEMRWILRAARGLRPADGDNFEVYSSNALMDLYENLTKGIFMVLVGVGSISLVVGGIVIMNIMLVSVTERTREIGVRKAVGARRRDVLNQFLMESLVVTITGGLVGILIGFAVSTIVSATTGFPARITLSATLLGFGVSAAVGLFFGIFPASRAARLDPVTALRAE